MRKITTPRCLFSRFLTAAAICLAPFASQAQDFPEPYCDVTFSEAVEPITIVQFAGIDNTTDGEVDGTPALEDFTDITGSVSPGLSYEITLDGNTDGFWTDYFFVYADWNQDGDFEDDSEAYYVGEIAFSDGDGSDPATATISVPTTATEGTTRMRVLKIFGESEDPGSCSDFLDYGQAEDYSLEVVALDCTMPTVTYAIVPDCDENEFSVTIDLDDLGDADNIEVKEGDESLYTFTAAGTYTAGPFTSGTSHIFTLVHSGDDACTLTSAAQTYNCPPLNDDCSGAIALTVNPDGACGTVTSGTTNAATESMEGCIGYADDDVWYSFEATAATHTISLSAITGSSDDLVIEVLDDCDGTNLVCSDPESTTATDLTPGNTYYIRVYTYYEDDDASFDICVGSLGEGSTCDDPKMVTGIPYSDESNTGDYGDAYSGSPGSSCSDDDYLSGYDVVYAYTATASGSINIEVIPDDTYAGVFVYGSCDDIGVSCMDGAVNGFSTSTLNIDDFAVTEDQTYYIVISTWASPYTVGYELNITEGATCVAPGDLSAGSFTSTSALAAWESDGTEFELEWGDEGFTLGDGTLETGITSTSYTIDGLTELNSYSFYVKRICSGTDESDWAGPYTFTVPGPGWTCDNPIEVTEVPYTTDDNTADYGDAFSGSPGATGCGTDYNYLGGNDVIYSYTPETSGSIDIELIPDDTYTGLFIYTDCDDIGSACAGGGVTSYEVENINIDDFEVEGGTTYYFVISTWPDPETVGYTFNITNNEPVVTGIVVVTEGDVVSEIITDDGTLQMEATVFPAEADQSVTWSIVAETGTATISSTGLVTAISNGIVWAKAVSVADPTYFDSLAVSITNQVLPADGIDVSVADAAPATITIAGGTLQLVATVFPDEADQDVTWSLIPVTGSATISSSGLVTAVTNGTVWAKAIVDSDVSLADSIQITITNQITDLENIVSALGFTMHPNPSHASVRLQMQSEHPALSIAVTDINGRELNTYTLPANGLSKGFDIDLSKLPSGAYLVKISGKNINFAQTLIKN